MRYSSSTPQQRDAALSPAEAAYLERTPTSQRLWRDASSVMPRGVSGAAKWFAPYPVFLSETSGSSVRDVDGNRYVDLLMGAGPMLLGHAHPHVVAAIAEQAAAMTNPMMPTELGHRYAGRIQSHMPYLERLRFTNTGSEATRTAVRIARAVTGRTKIAKFEGGFHGSDDVFLVSTHSHATPGTDERPAPVVDYAGLSSRLADEVLVLPYNNADATTALLEEHGAELAAVIMEPVAFSSGGGVPASPEFAAAVREVTARHGILLIFDEVVCAYRMGLGGAPEYLGVTPDLSTIGKAIGGGLPLAAVGGRADVMEQALGLDAGERLIFQSGTFTENPLSLAAGMAVLDVLESEPVLARADDVAQEIRAGLAGAFDAAGVQAAVTGFRSVFQVHLGASSVENRRDLLRSDLDRTRLFLLGMVAAGVLWPPVHPAVTSGAHSLDDAELVVAAARRVLEQETSVGAV